METTLGNVLGLVLIVGFVYLLLRDVWPRNRGSRRDTPKDDSQGPGGR